MRIKAVTLAVSSLLISGNVLALSPAGKTMIAKGDVKAYEEASNARKLKRRAPIYGVDTVETAEKSKAQFRMNDGTLLALKESSKLLISEYQYNAEEGGGSAVLELVEGGLRSVTGAIKSNNGSYELKTPVGSIGIRGTHYEVELIDGSLFIAVWDGAIDVSVETAGTNQVVSFGEGEDFSYAVVDEEGEVTELLAPPENFNEGHSSDPTQEENSEEDSSEEGSSEEGSSEEGSSEEGKSEEEGSEEEGSEEGGSEEGGSEEGGSEEGGSEEGGSEEGGSEEGGSEEGGSEEGGSEEGGSEGGSSEEGGSEEGGSEGGSSEEGGSESGGSEGGSSEEGGSESGGSEGGSSGESGSEGGSSGDSGSESGGSSGSGGSESGGSGDSGAGGTGDSGTGGADSGGSNTDPGTGTTDPGAGSTDPGTGDTGGIGDTDTTPPDIAPTPPPTDPDPGDSDNPIDEVNEERRDNQIIQEINNNTRALPEVIAARTGTGSFSSLISSSFDASSTGNPSNLNINISVNFDTALTEGDLNISSTNGQWDAFFQGVLVDADFELVFTSVTFGVVGQANSVLQGSGTWGETFLANEANVINGSFSLNQGNNNVSAQFILGENP